MEGKRFRGDLWFQERVNRRVKVALEEQNAGFARQHRDDTDGQLLDYVRAFSLELGRTPNSCEIIGGAFISRRFGSWSEAVAAAGLRKPGQPPPPARRLIYKREFKRQAAMFQRERQKEKQQRREQRRQESIRQRQQREAQQASDTTSA